MKTKKDEYDLMKAEYEENQESLGANDDNLSSSKEALDEAVQTKADDEEFLAKLVAMCKAKTAEYEDRRQMRANEDAAIAEAISILNSDAAFDTFGSVEATKSGATGFIQLAKVKRHMSG